jgi:hypothetical protein
MSSPYTPLSAISGGKKNLKMCVRVAHIWLIPEKNVPTNIIFMNMLLVDAKVCPIMSFNDLNVVIISAFPYLILIKGILCLPVNIT